jgi:hypothetical protein
MRSLSKISVSVKFQEWLEKTTTISLNPRPRIECNDGFSMSVQGGEFSYSNPRQFGSNFTEMEIGFPSEYEELIIDYAQSNNNPTDTVYPYVPVEVIIEVIKKHKGMKKN